MSLESKNFLLVPAESIPGRKTTRNVIKGNSFRTLPFYDLLETGEGVDISDQSVDAEKLLKELNQLEKDSRRYRRFRRR